MKLPTGLNFSSNQNSYHLRKSNFCKKKNEELIAIFVTMVKNVKNKH